MDKVIRFYVKSVYGNALMYPVDNVKAIETLTGKKTLTPTVINGLTLLGYSFTEVLESTVKKEALV